MLCLLTKETAYVTIRNIRPSFKRNFHIEFGICKDDRNGKFRKSCSACGKSCLEYFGICSKAREPVSIKQVAQSLELPNTTAFRIVKQLSIRGYLEESESQPGCYHLGLQLLTLSNGMTYINNLRQVCHAELDHLAIESHQAVQMGILKGNHVTYIEQILPPNPVLIYTTLMQNCP